MNEKDMVTKVFLEDNDRFADVVNAGVFHGKVILSGGQLKNINSFASAVFGKLRKKMTVHKYRDLIKKSTFGVNFALIGVENQTDIHYAMPVRIMGYDFLGYEVQLREIRKRHRMRKDLSGAEFISGFSKKDKLYPILTLVVYYGEEPWDGPESLFQMIDWKDIPKEVREKVVDYPLYVLDVRHFTGNEQMKTDTRIVFGFLQRQNDICQLKQYIKENEEEFSDMQEDAYDMISILSNSRELIECKDEHVGEKGEYNMCEAIKQMKEEGRLEGRLEGKGLGKAEAVLELLEMNGTVSEKEKNIVLSQKDGEVLSQWLRKAAKAETVEDFFENL